MKGGGKERQVEGANSETGGRGTARVGTCPARVGTYQKSPFEDKRPEWRKGCMMGIWGRFHDSAGGSHRTCGNVYLEQCFFAIQRGVCTERVGTYAYRGAFPRLGGRVAQNVSERVFFI